MSRIEQFAHPGLDRVRQLARDDDERLFLTDMSCSLALWLDPFQSALTRLFELRAAAAEFTVSSGSPTPPNFGFALAFGPL